MRMGGSDSSFREVSAAAERPSGDPLRELHASVGRLLLESQDRLPYHGWHHVWFVATKAIEFAAEQKADEVVVGAAALVHDLNYEVEKNSDPEAGYPLADRMLANAGFTSQQRNRVLALLSESWTANRGPELSLEGACLADADNLFKALPITPILLAQEYLRENQVSLRQLAMKIVKEQRPLLDSGRYFYLESVRDRYEDWASQNVMLWERVLNSMDSEDVQWLVDEATQRVLGGLDVS